MRTELLPYAVWLQRPRGGRGCTHTSPSPKDQPACRSQALARCDAHTTVSELLVWERAARQMVSINRRFIACRARGLGGQRGRPASPQSAAVIACAKYISVHKVFLALSVPVVLWTCCPCSVKTRLAQEYGLELQLLVLLLHALCGGGRVLLKQDVSSVPGNAPRWKQRQVIKRKVKKSLWWWRYLTQLHALESCLEHHNPALTLHSSHGPWWRSFCWCCDFWAVF